MQNIKEDKQIYLSGGGNEKQSFPLDKFFFNELPKNGSFLYIPIALRGHSLYLTAHLWMENILKLHDRTDLHFKIVDDLLAYKFEELKTFDGVYIGGGNTWSLMQELKNSGFSNSLIQYIHTKVSSQVYGGSAGAIILGKRIDTHYDPNKPPLIDVSGLNFLHNYSVACHFKNEQSERFKKWSTDNNLPIICLSEETGLIVKNNVALCVGTKPCKIYFASGAESDINSGESFNL